MCTTDTETKKPGHFMCKNWKLDLKIDQNWELASVAIYQQRISLVQMMLSSDCIKDLPIPAPNRGLQVPIVFLW